jgi:hypothetical protein
MRRFGFVAKPLLFGACDLGTVVVDLTESSGGCARDVIDARLARSDWAWPACEVGFAAKIPTSAGGLQIVDRYFDCTAVRCVPARMRFCGQMGTTIPL